MIEALGVEGYVHCRCGCGRLVLTTTAHLTGLLSFDCWLRAPEVRQLHEYEIAVRGGKTSMPVPRRKRRGNKGSKETRRNVQHARERALRRLKNLHPDTYAILYAEERAKAGMHPVPRREPLAVTLPDHETYDAADLSTAEM